MYKIAICDDEPVLAEAVKRKVDKFFSEYEMEYDVDVYYTGKDLTNAIKNNIYNMIFLDIELGDMNGIAVAAKIRKTDRDVMICIVSSYEKYSCQGYLVNAFRYIVRNMDTLQADISECLSSAIRAYDEKNLKKLFVFKEREVFVFIKKIIYIESHGHELIVYIDEDESICEYHMRNKLDDVEQYINSNFFFRANKSELVNILYVTHKTGDRLYLNKEGYIKIARHKINEYAKVCAKIVGK